jgi:CBS domain-containing protein
MPNIEKLLTGRPLQTLPASATVMKAARWMAENHIGCILITDDADRALGIFTERDLMTRVVVAGLDPDAVALSEVMTTEVFTATKSSKIKDMRREMQQRHIRHLPVVEGDKAIAMLSLRDLLAADLAATNYEKRAMTEYIQGSVDQQG